jgi:hypothetical protein
MSRNHRVVAWVCSLALALVALGAPLHALAHAQQAAAGASTERDPAAASQAHACEQCLQFAALDAGAAVGSQTLSRPAVCPERPLAAIAPALRGTLFQAYAARAPPALG